MKKPVTNKLVPDVELPKGENGKPDFSAFGEIMYRIGPPTPCISTNLANKWRPIALIAFGRQT